MTDETKALTPYQQLTNFIKTDSVQERFNQLLGERAPQFLSALLTVVNDDSKLQLCTPKSILKAAAKTAIKDLPIDPALGMSYLIPRRVKGVWEAHQQDGYKGIVQLAHRTGRYVSINADAVYQGEEVNEDRMSGNIVITGKPISREPIGYFAYFKLVNGFEKSLYWEKEGIIAHAEKYSDAYQHALKNGYTDTPWIESVDDMCKKTVLTKLLKRWGLLSIQWQPVDDPRPFISEVPEFNDIPDGEIVDGELTDPDPKPEADPLAHIYKIAVEMNLSENEHAAKNALAKRKEDSPLDPVRWMIAYRGWRDMGDTPAKAAASANKGQEPK